MPKVSKSENSEEGSYGWTLTHTWRIVQCSHSTNSVFREVKVLLLL